MGFTKSPEFSIPKAIKDKETGKIWAEISCLNIRERVDIDEDSIVLHKYQVIVFWDEYRNENDYNTSSNLAEYEVDTEDEANKLAEKLYNEDVEKFDKQNGIVYLKRYDVIDYTDNDNPYNSNSFGLSYEEYEELHKPLLYSNLNKTD